MNRLPLAITVLAAVLGGGVPAAGEAQQAQVQGIVIAAATAGPLEGVLVTLDTAGHQAYGGVTDRNGFYHIGGIRPGTYSLQARLLGYSRQARSVTVAAGDRLTVSLRLETEPVPIEGLVVAGAKGAITREEGRQVVRPVEIGRVPAPAGSGDLATYLQTLPGVSTTGDRGGQLFVRGGTPAENLVLVDGIPIYQPFHILGYFSVFPEDLVSSVDFYAGGFGARYQDRTSSVLDVSIRDGNPGGTRAVASAGPFLAEALVEGRAGPNVLWLASARRSLIEETSEALMGSVQPLSFESQLLKITTLDGQNRRCSVLGIRTSDSGRLDPEETESRVAWQNLVLGGRCITQFTGLVRLLEVNFSISSTSNTAVSRGSSAFHSNVTRVQHDAHATSLLGAVPLAAGYQTYLEVMNYDLSELFGVHDDDDAIFGASGYLEAALPLGVNADLRPGLVLALAPHPGVQPRLRASWQPFGRPSEQLQGAFGLYQQDLVGASDMRDVSSVFQAWMSAPAGAPLRALHGLLGWQQSLGGGLQWSLEGYYKRLQNIPVPIWHGVAQFSTKLGLADGDVYGADARVEYSRPRFHGFVGYGYSWTRYQAEQAEFAAWFDDAVQRFHPPHDRRHQVNGLASLVLAGFEYAARWQLGSGLPFTRPLGFDEEFNYAQRMHDVRTSVGTTRLLLDRPLAGRLPVMHRLDVSVGRDLELPFGQLSLQAGMINVYDRRNIFYYDLYTARRVDQLPRAPYASVTLRTSRGQQVRGAEK